jgi:hypothetical protein
LPRFHPRPSPDRPHARAARADTYTVTNLNDAGADQSKEATGRTTTVTLDGAGSSDPDGDKLTYRWEEGNTTLGTGVTLSRGFSVGSHTLTLTVTDPRGASATDAVTVTITDNTAPVISGVSARPDDLSPADTRFVPVTVRYRATDNAGAEPTGALSVASNFASADGEDVIIVDAHHLKLRARKSRTGSAGSTQ